MAPFSSTSFDLGANASRPFIFSADSFRSSKRNFVARERVRFAGANNRDLDAYADFAWGHGTSIASQSRPVSFKSKRGINLISQLRCSNSSSNSLTHSDSESSTSRFAIFSENRNPARYAYVTLQTSASSNIFRFAIP